MTDIYEEVVELTNYKKEKVLYQIFNICRVGSYILALAWFLTAFYTFNYSDEQFLFSLIILIVPPVLIIGLGLYFGYIKNKFCNTYDYVLVSGQLSFARVINQTKRLEIATIESYNIERIGLYGSEKYIDFESNSEYNLRFLTSNKVPQKDKIFYYICFSKSSKKYLYVIECTKDFMKNICKGVNRYLIDEEIK